MEREKGRRLEGEAAQTRKEKSRRGLTVEPPPCFAANCADGETSAMHAQTSESQEEGERTAMSSAISVCSIFFSSRSLPTCDGEESDRQQLAAHTGGEDSHAPP